MVHIYNISDIEIPLVVPSVDMCTGEVVCFTSSKIRAFSDSTIFVNDAEIGCAVQASCSFPVVFSPCDYNGNKLIDGGARENVPWREVKFLGADKVLSIIFENEVDESCCKNLIDVAFRSFELMGKELSKYELDGMDYSIKIKSEKVSLLDMSKIDEFFQLGYKETKNFLKENKILMQYFEWYLRPENKLWNKAIANAQYLSAIGITDVWFPPAYKGAGGKYDVGYSAYDLYDLGEFDQKGSIETKYGTKEEYINAIKKLHENGIRVYADIVLNHKIGADEPETVYASEEEQTNRNVDTSLPKKITAWTVYNFKGRNNKYSDFKWNYNHFNGTDWDESGRKNGVFRFSGKKWDQNVDAENGNYDYEALNCIDVKQFNEDMEELLAGKRVELPVYNFVKGEREYKGDFLQLGAEDILVIEGIHCLNDDLSYSLPRDKKFKIYISALTQLNIDDHNRVPTTDGRLIRRMVRDARTRGASAQDTIRMWDSVRRGEERNIFPYQEEADAMFNSAFLYELSVLKQYAEPILYSVPRDSAEYNEAKRLLKFLDYFLGVSSEQVPHNSIVREFIGGSCFKV